LLDLIAQNGPLTIAQYMHLCLHDPADGYYAARPALGADGDFITAPETSQMFGEMVGLWCAQAFVDLGSPDEIALIECGPGTGALASDLWRASKALAEFRAALSLYLIEPSAPLRAAQQSALADVGAGAQWIHDLHAAKAGPSIIVGNEVLDCLPIRQFVRTQSDWRERLVGAKDGALAFGFSPAPAAPEEIPPPLRDAAPGAVAEVRSGLAGYIDAVAARLHAAPGRALFIDYGAPAPSGENTFQAVRAHRSANPLDEPGGADLTAHVDFAHVAALARANGLDVAGPVPQGAFLRALGIEARAAALSAARPEKAALIARQLHRLIGDDQMGVLFQATCLSSPELPAPAGFAP
jgi:NADH dehydrogenase [ubiquinone] 1 alpha subcomplex assembly factor 7